MATESLKSTVITNRDATPVVLSNASLANARLHEAIGSVTITSGKTTGSKYTLAQVPSNCRVSQLLVSCPALSASSAADFGVYRSTADGGAVVSAALFGSAIDLSSALSNLDITNESTNYTLDKQEQPLWQAAGLSVDPGGVLDIVATTTATNAAGGLLGIKIRFVM